jgi:hypothetical protein
MTYRLPDRFAGKRCRCRECGDSIRVPAIGEESDVEEHESHGSGCESGADSREDSHVARKKVAPKTAPARDKKPGKPAGKLDQTERKAAPRPGVGGNERSSLHAATGRRGPAQTSESLHQMAPLNLSESRCMDPPAARARIKQAKAAAGAANAKKKQRSGVGGPGSESELDVAPRAKRAKSSRNEDKLEKKSKKKNKKNRGAKKRDDSEALDESDVDADDESDADLRPAKKKKAKKADKRLAARKRRSDDDANETDADAEDDADEAPALSPREAQRRQQLRILAGSFGVLVVVVGLLIGIVVHGNAKEAASAQKLADSKKKIADARAFATSSDDLDKADKLFKETIAFIEDPATALPDDDIEFTKDLGLFRAEQGFFKKIADARAKLATDKEGALTDFGTLVTANDDMVREAGIAGLAETNDSRAAAFIVPFANNGTQRIKNAARKALLQLGGKEVDPLLAAIIREDKPDGPMGKLAVERALASQNADALVAICELDNDAQHKVAAINSLARNFDQRAKAIAEKLSQSADAEVKQAAEKALTELKGFEKG